jgi:23S rRNA (pseudouridine1915-N3)-methyltransferase
MKITLLAIGKTTEAYLLEGLEAYEKRLPHYVNYTRKELSEAKNSKSLPVESLKRQEGKCLLAQLSGTEELFLLDENGAAFSSEEMAGFVRQKMASGLKSLVFAIGGAYGFSEEVYQKAAGKISLSRLTFPHQLVRLIFTEQLYRACTIIKGEPYHHR